MPMLCSTTDLQVCLTPSSYANFRGEMKPCPPTYTLAVFSFHLEKMINIFFVLAAVVNDSTDQSVLETVLH